MMTLPFALKLLLVSAGVLAGLIVGGIALLRSLLLFVTVKGASMTPTLRHQDRVLVLRARAVRKIKKGAIVLLDASALPNLPSPGTSFIKRVVAVAGETYTEPGTSLPLQPVDELSPLKETRRWLIPPGMVFVCGDHLAASSDSRAWGPVPLSIVEGVVIYHFKKQTP
jgi:signal peptidase I